MAPAILDLEIFTEVVGHLGRDRTNDLLAKLGDQLQRQFPAAPVDSEDRTEIAAAAHKLISMAGAFGFTALADSCVRLEAAAAASQGDLRAMLDDARAVCASTLVEINALLARPNLIRKSA